jgi:hypothetical protein
MNSDSEESHAKKRRRAFPSTSPSCFQTTTHITSFSDPTPTNCALIVSKHRRSNDGFVPSSNDDNELDALLDQYLNLVTHSLMVAQCSAPPAEGQGDYQLRTWDNDAWVKYGRKRIKNSGFRHYYKAVTCPSPLATICPFSCLIDPCLTTLYVAVPAQRVGMHGTESY